MKKMTGKRMLAAGMAALMMCGTGGVMSVQASEYPDYLNLESARPIIKDGEDVTLSVMVMRESIATSDINENWFVKFIEEKLNINLDIEEVNLETFEERRNLKLASDDLPDIMINMRLSASDIVTYGVDGEQLLPLSDYISDELTPNIAAMIAENTDAATANTAPDGKMYTLPNISANYPGYGNTIGNQRVFIDKKYMEAAGIEKVPETLDEFVDMLRAFKALDPAEMGVNEIWPMVSTWGNDRELLQNAFGWLANGNNLSAPALDVETGEVVIPCAQEKYADYVTLLNTLYTEGLIHPDFFTMDKTAARALYAEGSVPVLCDAAPYLSVPERFDEYVSAIPLSSQYCETGITRMPVDGIGTAVVSADTEYPEVCMRLLDYLYSDEGSVYSYMGCPADSEDTMGLIGGFSLDENQKVVNNDVVSGKYESDFDYSVNAIELSQSTPYNQGKNKLYAQKLAGIEDPEYPEMDLTNPDDHYRYICYEAHQGHLVKGLPDMYLGTEDAARYSDLQTVIQNHVDAETAKFVVGQRPLSELSDFFEELKALGIEEYEEICKSAYADYMAAQE